MLREEIGQSFGQGVGEFLLVYKVAFDQVSLHEGDLLHVRKVHQVLLAFFAEDDQAHEVPEVIGHV